MTLGLQTLMDGATATTEACVLVGQSDAAAQRSLCEALSDQDCVVQTVGDVEGLLGAARDRKFDAVFLDVDLTLQASAGTVQAVREKHPHAALVVAVSRQGGVDGAELLRLGADAFLYKPLQPEAAATTLRLAARISRLRRDLRSLDDLVRSLQSEEQLVGCSPVIRRLSGVVRRAGENDATVLIEGREGAGKTLVAQLIHADGRRASGPLKVLHADALTTDDLEQALCDAAAGTLLIESVDRLSGACQSRLVRFLKERGGAEGGPAHPEPRIIASTTARLAELTAKGSFREDLYYRLNMFPVVVPNLAERREDIPLLASHFARAESHRAGKPDKGYTPSAIILLETHPWPGNVSQLKSTIARAYSMAQGEPIDRVHLFGPSTGVTPQSGVVDEAYDGDEDVGEDDILPFQDEEKRILNRALQATRGNVRRAAQLLGIGRATLYRKIQIYQLRLQ